MARREEDRRGQAVVRQVADRGPARARARRGVGQGLHVAKPNQRGCDNLRYGRVQARGGSGAGGSDPACAATSPASREPSARPKSPSAFWIAITASVSRRPGRGSPRAPRPARCTPTISAQASDRVVIRLRTTSPCGPRHGGQTRVAPHQPGDRQPERRDADPVPGPGRPARSAPIAPKSSTDTTATVIATAGPARPEGPLVVRAQRLTNGRSQPAGVDVGDQDRPGPDVVQLVHDLVGARPRHHRAHGDPALVVQRRDGRRLQARGQRAGPLDVLDPARRSPSARSCRATRTPCSRRRQHLDLGVRLRARGGGSAPPRTRRIGSPKISSPAARRVVPVSTTSAITSATPELHGALDRAVEPDHRRP